MAEREREARQSEHRAPGDTPTTTAETDLDALRTKLDEARTQADQQRGAAEEYLSILQRVQADFLNYKRRVEAEREAQAEAVRAETIRAFLPVADDLGRALAHVPPELAEQSWAQGFELIDRNLAAAFERLGVRKVGSEGEPFDPNVHEAVAYEEHPIHPEGRVAAVLRPGYQLGERVVRPAQVVVARAPVQGDRRDSDAWPRHKSRRGHPNGGVEPADLHRPRGIERA